MLVLVKCLKCGAIQEYDDFNRFECTECECRHFTQVER